MHHILVYLFFHCCDRILTETTEEWEDSFWFTVCRCRPPWHGSNRGRGWHCSSHCGWSQEAEMNISIHLASPFSQFRSPALGLLWPTVVLGFSVSYPSLPHKRFVSQVLVDPVNLIMNTKYHMKCSFSVSHGSVQ